MKNSADETEENPSVKKEVVDHSIMIKCILSEAKFLNSWKNKETKYNKILKELKDGKSRKCY